MLEGDFGSNIYEILKYPCQAIHLHEYYFGERFDKNFDEATNISTYNKVVETSIEELSYGFYDIQLNWVSKYFAKEHIKIIFQEDMYNNTLHTLREVELFLQIPCYDFASIAIFPQVNSPPLRKPETYKDRIGQIASSLQPWTGKDSSSQFLQRTILPETKSKLKEVYRSHVINLISTLNDKFDIKEIPHGYL